MLQSAPLDATWGAVYSAFLDMTTNCSAHPRSQGHGPCSAISVCLATILNSYGGGHAAR
jgi:hypothetical protein